MSGTAEVAPLRVLHVYAGNLYGGVERLLAVLATARAETPGLEPHFALCFDGRLADELRAAGAPPHLLGPVRLRRPWTVLRARRALRRTVARVQPQVVVCHASWTHGLLGPAARVAGVPLVFWLHDAASGRGWADRLARRVRPALAVCTSRYASTTLPRLWPGMEARVVYPPVPAPREGDAVRAEVRAELDTPEGDVVIVQASRMEPWKGHRLHLEALETLHQVGGWTCWLAGGARRPHERRHLAAMRELAERLGIAHRVRFLGERDDVPRLMAAADVLCQPNLGPEPFGIAFVEGMHAGLPVVATALGGVREVVDPTCGVLVPPDDARALGEALRELVVDARLRQRLGEAGRARAGALCDPRRQAQALEALLRAVAGGGTA